MTVTLPHPPRVSCTSGTALAPPSKSVRSRIAPSPDYMACTYVFFDLETGGLDYTEHNILQIAAVCDNSDVEFNVYVPPTRAIEKEASLINRLTEKDGQLYYKKRPVTTVPIDEALKMFVNFLQELPLPPILVGHYINKFDLPFLKHYMMEHNLWEEFSQTIKKFVDTYELFKQEYLGLFSYKQQDLVISLLGLCENYEAHNALNDAKALRKLSKLVKHRFLSHNAGLLSTGWLFGRY